MSLPVPTPASEPPRLVALVTAFNEERTIGAVVAALTRAPSIAAVWVVDDGSTDGTAARAREHGARVHRLEERIDVGSAIHAGACLVPDDALLFLCDADLIDLTPEHVEAVAAPVRAGDAAMSIGVKDSLPLLPARLLPVVARLLGRRRGRAVIDGVIRRALLPGGLLLGGERALPAKLLREAYRRSPHSRGYGLVLVLNQFFLRNGLAVRATFLEGCTHSEKYAKWGAWDAARGLGRLLFEIPATYARLLLRPGALRRG